MILLVTAKYIILIENLKRSDLRDYVIFCSYNKFTSLFATWLIYAIWL